MPSRSLASALALLALLSVATAHADPSAPVNLAYGRPARQSSTIYGDPQYGADKAVDGQMSPLAHTDFEAHAWWEVDLGAVREIGHIEIVNRNDCCGDRLLPFVVLVADIPIIDSDITDADEAAYPGIMRTRVTGGAVLDEYHVPVNRSGRWVRIALLGANYLNVREIRVIEAGNLARGRNAWQSSTTPGGDAFHAVDNNVDGNWTSGSVAATGFENHPWWQVDLGSVQPIGRVELWNSTTCCSATSPQAAPFVWVSNEPIAVDPITIAAPGVQGVLAGGGGTQPLVVPVNKSGRFIMVEAPNFDALSIGEVQVFRVGHGADGAHASQSSTASGGSADLAIDGNASGDTGSSTETQNNPYWEVDLGAVRYLDTVRVWNRSGASLPLYDLFVAEHDFVDSSGQRVTTPAATRALSGVTAFVQRGATPSTTTAVMHRARFVRVMVEGNARLAMGEVDIGTPESYVSYGLLGGQLQGPPVTLDQAAWGYMVGLGSVEAHSLAGNGADTLVTTAYPSYWPTLGSATGETLFPWFAPVMLPSGAFPPGGAANVRFDAFDDGMGVPKPLRSLNADGSDNLFWPAIRVLSTGPTPDDMPNKPAYLTLPAGNSATTASRYVTAMNVAPDIEANYGQFSNRWYSAPNTGPADEDHVISIPWLYDRRDLGVGRSIYCRAAWGRFWPRYQHNPTSLWDFGQPFVACSVFNFVPKNDSGRPVFGDEAAARTAYQSGIHVTSVDVITAVRTNDFHAWRINFGAYDGNGQRVTATDLDGLGANRSVPGACMSCHGGDSALTFTNQTVDVQTDGPVTNQYNPLTGRFEWLTTIVHTNQTGTVASMPGGTFLPLDPNAYGYFASPGYSQDELADRIRELNRLMAETFQPGAAAGDFVNGLYGANINVASGPANPDYIPPGWSNTPAQRRVYDQVIKPNCRGCHLSQTAPGMAFTKAADLDAMRALIVSDICVTKRMPHGQQALKNLWTSNARAEILGYFGRGDFTGLCAP